jgi:phage gp29-like protein
MATLVDQFGQPITASTVTAEPQTAQLGWLYQEIGSHPARGLTPSGLNALLKRADYGDMVAQMQLFEDMEERDAHIYAEMMKRRSAIINHDWSIQPPHDATPEEQANAERIEAMIMSIPQFEDVMLEMMSAVGTGFACLEYERWALLDIGGKAWIPQSICLRPHSWFMMDWQTRMHLHLRNNTSQGEELRPFGWIRHEHKAKSGYLAKSGLYRVLAWPYLFKNYSVRDLAEFLEIYGLPLRVGRYPSGATDKEKQTLLQAVVGIGHNAAGIIPMGMELDFQEAAKGTEVPFKAMIEHMERSQSKAILGQTLSSQESSRGTQALGAIHREVQLDIQAGDARQIASTLTRDLIYPLHVLNIGPVDMHRLPRLQFDVVEAEDVSMYADSYPKLAAAGVQIPVRYIAEKLRIPEPEDGEEVLKGPAPAAAGNMGNANNPVAGDKPAAGGKPAATGAEGSDNAALSAQSHQSHKGPRDAIDDLIDAAMKDWQVNVAEPTAGVVLTALAKAVDKGMTPQQFRALLPELLAHVPLEPLTDRLAKMGFVVNMAGQAGMQLDDRKLGL